MPKKYYAVRKGYSRGIFESWDVCESLVKGYPGAEYKSFLTLEEANSYLNLKTVPKGRKKKNLEDEILKQVESFSGTPKDTLRAFVDGSFDKSSLRYAFGCVIITPDGEVIKESGIGENELAKTSWNVAGELTATMFAVKWAIEKGYKKLIVHYDYEGISKWYQKSWKANSYCATEYLKFMDKFRPYLQITFEKVKAHTGVPLNELADILAKDALGIK